jgi:hypothetical protein
MAKKIMHLGIDPDVDKSGYCEIIKQPFGKWEIVTLDNLDFFDVIQHINQCVELDSHLYDITVCIEAGYLNKSIHHVMKSNAHAAKIGTHVGSNHQVGRLFESFCKKNDIAYKLYKPTSSKWDAELFKKITGYTQRTNQEQRDAVRAAWL